MINGTHSLRLCQFTMRVLLSYQGHCQGARMRAGPGSAVQMEHTSAQALHLVVPVTARRQTVMLMLAVCKCSADKSH